MVSAVVDVEATGANVAVVVVVEIKQSPTPHPPAQQIEKQEVGEIQILATLTTKTKDTWRGMDIIRFQSSSIQPNLKKTQHIHRTSNPPFPSFDGAYFFLLFGLSFDIFL